MHIPKCILYKIPIDLEVEPVINLHVNKPKKRCRHKSKSCKHKCKSKRKSKSCNCKKCNSTDKLVDKLVDKLIYKLCISNYK